MTRRAARLAELMGIEVGCDEARAVLEVAEYPATARVEYDVPR